MCGVTKSGSACGWVHVRNVRADGEMNCHGDAVLVGGDEDAGIRVLHFEDAARKKLPGSFAVADADAMRKFGNFVEIFSRLFGHAEVASAQGRLDVFGRVSGQRDFEVVDERGPVHGNAGDETALY